MTLQCPHCHSTDLTRRTTTISRLDHPTARLDTTAVWCNTCNGLVVLPKELR